jgi:amidase
MATTVADAALGLTVMAGAVGHEYRPRDEFDLRIAVAPQPLPPGFSIDAEFRTAVVEAAETLRVAGHTVVDHPKRLPSALGLSTIATWCACAADEARPLDPHLLEKRTRALARAGRLLGSLGLNGSRGRDRWRAYAADQWFGDADVLITPTLAAPPPAADRWGRRGLLRTVRVNVGYAPATGAWNMAGWPAMSVPFGTHSTGLPIGVQLIGPPGAESQLLGLAAQLESARPWARHAPR